VKLSNKAKYIQENLSGDVDLRRKSAQQVHDLLTSRKYDVIDGDFKYLIKMPMDSVTQENVDKIMKDRDNAEKELAVLKKTSEQQMWLKELSEFETQYASYKAQREKIQSETQKRKATGGGASKGARKVPKQKK
jgi:DNA topoisomerase-2